MIVKITYDDKRLDIFDTATFTAPSPLGKQNMLTNFEVRFDDMEGSGLWAAAHSYRTDGSFKGDGGTDGVPVARRTKGWRFLLASAKELNHVELVVVDGEAILKRVCGELVDLQAFDEKAYEVHRRFVKGATREDLGTQGISGSRNGRYRSLDSGNSVGSGRKGAFDVECTR